MKKLIIIILTFGLTLYSCSSQEEKQVNTNKNSTVEIKKENNFDSTYYRQLTNAYNEKDSLKLKKIFEDWFIYSTQFITPKDDSLKATLLDIFRAVYHPFRLEKYGWLSRSHYLKYEYAIVPTQINYKVLKSLNNPDTLSNLSFDNLQNIFPIVNIERAKTLYDIQPFSKSLEIFLQTDSYDKLNFLNLFINTPISNDWKEYQTSPVILGMILNQNLNESYVDIRLISTGLRIHLLKKGQKWEMKNIHELWIE